MTFCLAFLGTDGWASDAVRDPSTGEPFESQHASTARRAALAAAAQHGTTVLLSRRVSDTEPPRPTLLIEPDGTCVPPPGMNSAHDREARVCFCPACRAQRAVKRLGFE